MKIKYAINRPLTAAQFIDLLNESTLGERRPVDRPDCIQGMLDHADLTITAWEGDHLIGIARSVTDFHYCCYLSDLAVSQGVQAQGIGRELVRQTFYALQPGCTVILLAAPKAVDYYPKIGFTQHHSAWLMRSVEELK